MLTACQAFSIWGFHFDSTAIVAIAGVVLVIFLVIQFKTAMKEHPKKVAIIVSILVVLLAAGAFAWKFCGPALNKYLNHAVDQSINGEANEVKAEPTDDADAQQPEALEAEKQDVEKAPAKKEKTKKK